MPAWFPVLRYVYQHGKWVSGSTCCPGLISARTTGEARAGTVLARAHKGQKTKFWGIFKTHPQTSHTPQGSQKVSRTPLIATTRPYSAPETPKKPFWAHFALPGPRGRGRPRERRCTAQPGRAPSPADPCGRVCAAAAPGEAHRCRGGAPQVGPGSSQNGPRARVARCARADQPGATG